MNNQNCCAKNIPDVEFDEIKAICEKIVQLQKEAVKEEEDQLCDRDYLGEQETSALKMNTRPVMLYTAEDKTWHCPIDRNEDDCEDRDRELSCVFRIEKVVGDSVFLRVLKKKHCDKKLFESTDSFITIKFKNIAALRCLKDTFVNICID